MNFIDDQIHEEFEGLHTPEEFTKACTSQEMIGGAIEKYSVKYHNLFQAIGLSTGKEVQNDIHDIAQFPQLRR